MRLLFAIKSLDVAGGGAERVLAVVASGLAARGHDVAVLTFDESGGASFYPLHARVRRICLGLGPVDRPTRASEFAVRVRTLGRVLRDEQPQVAIGFMHSMFVPLAFASTGLRIPIVASEHIVPEYYRGRRGEYVLFIAGCLLSARVTVLSAAVRDLYPSFLRGRMVPVPNPVSVPVRVQRERERRTILAVGRMEPQKDHATLIEAFALVADRFPQWDLRIVGDGSLRGDLEQLAAQRRLSDRVTMPGTTPHIEREYANADLVAVSSRFESFGMVTAEALAAGLPVIGFADCPGTNELIEHGRNGWLVRGDDRARSLAEGMAALMGDDARRAQLGQAGVESVAQFSPATVVSTWETMLGRVAARARASGAGE